MNKNKQNTRNKSYQPKKETIFDFEPYLNKQITIYFNGGRQIMGIVKSYDILSNLVLDNVKEIKYIFAYLSKKTGFTSPLEFKFDETKQFILESIIFTAFNLYNNGGASKSKLVDSHNRFVQEIENDKEEKLSRTQQLNTVKLQALRELGYTEINKDNASEVLNRMAEIQSRKM